MPGFYSYASVYVMPCQNCCVGVRSLELETFENSKQDENSNSTEACTMAGPWNFLKRLLLREVSLSSDEESYMRTTREENLLNLDTLKNKPANTKGQEKWETNYRSGFSNATMKSACCCIAVSATRKERTFPTTQTVD